MGTAPGEYPPARSSGSYPGWAATGLAAVTLAIRVSSAVPPLLTAIVARAYGRRESRGWRRFHRLRGCRSVRSLRGCRLRHRGEGGRRDHFSTPRRLEYALPCRLAVLPSCRLAVLPSCRYRLTMFVANQT